CLLCCCCYSVFFFSSRRRHTRSDRDWSSDVCSSDLERHRSLAVLVLGAHHQDGDPAMTLARRLCALVACDDAGKPKTHFMKGGQIGRASCRERVEGSGGARTSKKKETRTEDMRGRRS